MSCGQGFKRRAAIPDSGRMKRERFPLYCYICSMGQFSSQIRRTTIKDVLWKREWGRIRATAIRLSQSSILSGRERFDGDRLGCHSSPDYPSFIPLFSLHFFSINKYSQFFPGSTQSPRFFCKRSFLTLLTLSKASDSAHMLLTILTEDPSAATFKQTSLQQPFLLTASLASLFWMRHHFSSTGTSFLLFGIFLRDCFCFTSETLCLALLIHSFLE